MENFINYYEKDQENTHILNHFMKNIVIYYKDYVVF